MRTSPIIITILIVICLSLQITLAEQIDISRIERMPNMPAPYKMRNWKQVAIGYDSLVFNFDLEGTHLPLIWWNTATVNYPQHNSFGLMSAVGAYNQGSAEAINVLPAVIGASLVGIDKSNQDGVNWVLMCEEFFNKRPSENVYLNNPIASSGYDWWYDTMPNVFFYQLYDMYPETGDFNYQFKTVADRWLTAVQAMGGDDAPWQVPKMNYRAWSLSTMSPLASGVTQPEAAGALGWLLFNAFVETGELKYRIGAEWCLEFLNNRSRNPSYELQLPYGVYTAARMNAVLDTDYDIEKMLNWCFAVTGNVRDWGATLGNWGGYDCDGLIGEAKYAGYAFVMNGFEQAGALVPLVRYDDRFARAIGKWMLNLANASRLFYANYLPDDHQDCERWAHQYDPHSYIAYEALREYALHTGDSPYATGDFMINGWGATNLALYGASHVGILGGIVDTTNMPGILKLDALKTDYFNDQAYPTFLYFNPYNEEKWIDIDVGAGNYDLYDTITNTFLATNVSENTTFPIPADAAVLLVVVPGNGQITYERDTMLVNKVVVDYRAGRTVSNYPPRIKSLAAANKQVVIETDAQLYCTATDRDGDELDYTWHRGDSTLSGTSSQLTWTAPALPGDYTLSCIVEDVNGSRDSAVTCIEVVEYINHPPLILDLQINPAKVGINETAQLTCSASDPDNDVLSYTWNASDGEISGSDSSATWNAPPSQGYYFITCRVSDPRGGEAVDSVGVIVLDYSDIRTGIPVAYYPFNGNPNDASGFNLHGTAYGPTLVPDPLGQDECAYYFDGVDDFILVHNQPILNFTDDITVSFWIKVDEFFSEEMYPLSHGNWENRWKVSITPGTQSIRWTIKTTNGIVDLDSETPLIKDIFYHLIVLYNGTNLEIYVNGKLDNSTTWSGSICKTDIDLTIGRVLPNNTSHNFKGILDDVRIYSYAVSPQEIANIFNELTNVENNHHLNEIPANHYLHQNYPNPFNSKTTIRYQIKEAGRVYIDIYNMLGQKVKSLVDLERPAGYHSVSWDGKNESGQHISSGIYYCVMKINDFCDRRKIVILK